jgi:hypothetical protein
VASRFWPFKSRPSAKELLPRVRGCEGFPSPKVADPRITNHQVGARCRDKIDVRAYPRTAVLIQHLSTPRLLLSSIFCESSQRFSQ